MEMGHVESGEASGVPVFSWYVVYDQLKNGEPVTWDGPLPLVDAAAACQELLEAGYSIESDGIGLIPASR